MRRIKITLAYDGTDFYGWQVQPGLPTIQGVLEQIIGDLEGQPVHVAGSGRTDAGVHAVAQAAAFSIENPIPPYNLKKAVNRLLPPAVRILSVEEVSPGFHPRFDAVAKTYEYRILRGEVCPPWEWRYVHHYPYSLQMDRLAAAAPALEGEHDFTPFAASDDHDEGGQSKVRRIFSSRVEVSGDRVIYRVRGSGFLKHMVRNIVGVLVQVGKGNVADVWNAGPCPTAPAKGLFLRSVEYL